MTHDQLTTEHIRKKFKNNFDLCNFSIMIARNMIQASEQPQLGEILKQVEARASEASQPNAFGESAR